jgi:hypothetical protein
MSQRGHSPKFRSSSKPSAARRQFYIYATCDLCDFKASTSSVDGNVWVSRAIADCATTAARVPGSATTEQQLPECNLCCENTAAIVSCSAGHKVCGACFDRSIVDFNFTARQTCLQKRQLVAPDLHSWPFMCTLCLEDKVCNLFPIGTCMNLMSESSTRSLFHHLRQFKDVGDGESVPEVAPSEVAAVKRMVNMFFLPPRCPACHTPFVHDGGCMAMKCRGRAGVICQAHFCLWCLRVPKLVSVLGPHSTEQDRDGACHRHVFACPLAPPGSSTPGSSRLFPTEDPTSENSEWIVAWHHLQTIKTALKFLREMVQPNTAAAVMAAPEVSKLFADAAEFIQDRLKKRPVDRRLLVLPALKLDDPRFDSVHHGSVDVPSSDSSDSDYVPALPAGRMRMRVPRGVRDDSDDDDDDVHVIGNPHPRPQTPPPALEARAHLFQRFEDNVKFVMDSCDVNRRAATDALFAHERDPAKAIDFLLSQ